ncbi:antitoxin [Nocardioides rubriscoriae]|uniref:antitoxin n=1 Tax=Nocardioides rubriscoriae TaxID=642762 RepID=UPI0011E06D3D|nr:antitoxin [Nocardioides rubriscoriae]
MRTTVTLDPDTEQVVRQRMESHGVSFKQALNDAIRDGAAGRPRVDVFHTPAFDLGEPSVDLTRALRLAADLEDESVLERMRADG